MAEYYDGARLLSTRDMNGEKPEIFICTTNRTGGKTTYFNRLCVNRFLRGQGQFMLLFRYSYEVQDVAAKFFGDIQGLFFKQYEMKSKARSKGVYHELYISKKEDDTLGDCCGYAVALNSADAIKRFSHVFHGVTLMLFDEFQSETGKYLANEVGKLLSIHTSVARGNGEQIRYVPLVMLSNATSLLNPYYTALGISNRLKDDTKILRGNGFVMEQGYIESAADAQRRSAFNQAFSENKYVEFAASNKYLNDVTAFIERVTGPSRYLCTFMCDGNGYAIREYEEQGIVYVDDRPDTSYKDKIVVTVEDHDVNYVMLKRNSLFIENLRYFFEKGCFRFKNLRCREAALKLLSY